MLLDLLYLVIMISLSPWLLWRYLRTDRYRRDLGAKLTGRMAFPPFDQFTVWFHGVSVGEIHLLATLIAAYRQRHPQHRIVVSSTTDTGLAEARGKFEHVIVWPFDFSWAVVNALKAVQPDLVVLAEGEMWPNFLRAANVRKIPVVVVNARLSPRSFRRYARVAHFARRLLLDRVQGIAVQSQDYASRFEQLGVPASKLIVTGSIKYDGAFRTHAHSKLGEIVPKREELVWVAGSTHAPEEIIVLKAFAELHREFPKLRLILVPRHPDRFDEVARLLDDSQLPYQRRSRLAEPLAEMPTVLLLDSIGELGDAWSLADVGFVGGTLDGHRGGQSMIEPAGYGVPTVFGPHVWNFTDAARRLVEAGGAIKIGEPAKLTTTLRALLHDPERRTAMASAARQLVADQQGATRNTLDVLDRIADTASRRRAA